MYIKITFFICYLLVFLSLILNMFCVFTSWADLRFNVQLSQCPGHFTLIGSLRKFKVVIKSFKVVAIGAQVYKIRAVAR